MKKNWNDPAVESLDLEETMYSFESNPVDDGLYLDKPTKIFPDGKGYECCS